jgi:phosphoglycolate phosphatase-like HAD superfamily hydrolase
VDKTIAVDFDGVIHAYSRGWRGGVIYDAPVEGAFQALQDLFDAGYELVIFTTRDLNGAVEGWMNAHRGQFTFEYTVTNVKPMAIAYIDDRAIRFTNWADIRRYFV